MRALLLMVLLAGCAQPQTGTTCEVGTTRACTCGNSAGVATCLAPEDVWTECGCASSSGPDVAVAPAPPAPTTCGGQSCAPFTEEDTEVGAKGCCTTSGTCGSASRFLFGAQCLERGGPVGRPSDECPSESIAFVDVEGCCRPDGACGLSIDAVPNFDLGCLERTEMERLLNAGSGDRNTLSSVFFLPVRPASFAAKACTF